MLCIPDSRGEVDSNWVSFPHTRHTLLPEHPSKQKQDSVQACAWIMVRHFPGHCRWSIKTIYNLTGSWRMWTTTTNTLEHFFPLFPQNPTLFWKITTLETPVAIVSIILTKLWEGFCKHQCFVSSIKPKAECLIAFTSKHSLFIIGNMVQQTSIKTFAQSSSEVSS